MSPHEPPVYQTRGPNFTLWWLQGGRERDLSGRWAQYLAGRSDDDFCPSPELKALLRAGVPPEYRQRVWRCLVRIRTGAARERHPQRYQQVGPADDTPVTFMAGHLVRVALDLVASEPKGPSHSGRVLRRVPGQTC